MKHITLDGIEYQIALFDDILLEHPDYTLVLHDGWSYLKEKCGNWALDALESYIHNNYKEALKVNEFGPVIENEIKAPSMKDLFECLNPKI